MNRTYRVSLEIDLSAMERVDAQPDDNVITFHLEVDADSAPAAVYHALNKFADDADVISVVPVREG